LDGTGASPSKLRLFRDGVLVDVLNPKTGLFFLAFLPQFVDPARGAASSQVIVLGLCFVALAVLTDGTYALLAGALRPRVAASGRGQGLIRRVTGAVYTGLGGLAAVV
jgi:threonine/homoserine/homoserine lactone efflux protein